MEWGEKARQKCEITTVDGWLQRLSKGAGDWFDPELPTGQDDADAEQLVCSDDIIFLMCGKAFREAWERDPGGS